MRNMAITLFQEATERSPAIFVKVDSSCNHMCTSVTWAALSNASFTV